MPDENTKVSDDGDVEKERTSFIKAVRKTHDDNDVEKIKNGLTSYEVLLTKMQLPVDNAVLLDIREQVFAIYKEIKRMPEQAEISKIKRKMFHKIQGIIKKVNATIEKNEKIKEKRLKEIKEEIFNVIESTRSFQKKMEDLDIARSKLDAACSDDKRLKNKIQGFKIAESMNYLRSIKAKVDSYRLYVEDFPFSKDVTLWGDKVYEICSLKKDLQEIPRSGQCVEERIESVQSEVNEVLKILDSKATSTGKILTSLENLINLSSNIHSLCDQESLTALQKLDALNAFRKKIANFDTLHTKLSTKKLEVLLQLQRLEENIYRANYGEDVLKVKQTLNCHERDVEEGNREDKLNEVSELSKDIKESFPDINPLNDNAELLLQLLSATQVTEKPEDDQPQEAIEFQLTQIKERLETTQENATVSKFDKIFSLKEQLEDISIDDHDLSSQKQSLLEIIINNLKVLDEDVANFAQIKPKVTNILDLQSHFKLDLETIRLQGESSEFIAEIHRRAKAYEICIENFFGKRSSIYYYVIYENLIRLLEELDKVKSDDQNMLNTMITNINYIKSLITALELHTYDN